MESLQFIGTSPDVIVRKILTGVDERLNDLKDQFQPKEPEEYLTRKQVSELLQVDLSTLHRWTKCGKLIAYGIGNRVYYKRTEVEQALLTQNSH